MIQGQTARDVQLLSDQAPQLGLTSAEGEDARSKGEMKRRVLFLSAIIAMYVVINALVQYVFDAAAIETALEQIRSVTDVKGGPVLAKLLLRMIPGVTVSIILGLLVPFCGYIGAQQDNQGLVGCFCCCNAFNCGCASLGFISMVVIIGMLSAATPGIEAYLEACDPVQCSHLPADLDPARKQALIVDCLAAGTWPEYQQRFPGNPKYPDICPKVMLKCQQDDMQLMKPVEPSPLPPFLRGAGAFPFRGGQPAHGPGAWADSGVPPELPELPMQEDVDALGVAEDVLDREEAVAAREDEAPDEDMPEDEDAPNDRRLQMFNGHLKRRSWRELPTWDDSDLSKAHLGPMPNDPIASCKPNGKGMKVVHQASLLLPELMPKLLTFMAVKLLLVVPVILLSCLGCWWGSGLYSKLGQGYGQLANNRAPVVAPHVEVPMLPVQAVQAQPSAPAVQAATVAVDRAE